VVDIFFPKYHKSELKIFFFVIFSGKLYNDAIYQCRTIRAVAIVFWGLGLSVFGQKVCMDEKVEKRPFWKKIPTLR